MQHTAQQLSIFNFQLSILPRHYLQHQFIRFVHSFRTYLGQITDTLIYIFINNSLYRSYTTVFHGHDGGKNSGRYTSGYFQRTAGFRTVTNHTRKVGYHILNGISHLIVSSSQQPHSHIKQTNAPNFV